LAIIIFVGASFLTEPKVIEVVPAQTSENIANQTTTLIFTGDIMLDRGVKYQIDKNGQGDYNFSFLKIADDLQKADLLIANLEGPISDKGSKVGSIYSFRMDPKSIGGLKYAGFDILSLANNHMLDYTRLALEDTFLRLKEAEINYVGAGFNKYEAYSPLIKEINGSTGSLLVKVAFLSFTNLGSQNWQASATISGIAWLTDENLKSGIETAKKTADIVIVSFHFGEEYQENANINQKYFSHLAIDYGADLVVGHHPHVIQNVEAYKNGIIAYSLGNFIFDQNFSEETMKGLALEIFLEDGKIVAIKQDKIKLNQSFQPEVAD